MASGEETHDRGGATGSQARRRDADAASLLAAGPPEGDTAQAPRWPPLADLLRGGLLSEGDRLRLHQPRARRTAHAVHADGTLRLDGHGEAYTPSAAAAVVTGSQINGWSTWQRESDGRTLHQLRTALREPGDAN